MKNRYKYIATLLIGFLVVLSSCNDSDFLKEVPETFYTVENSFNTVDQVNASVTNQYVHIRYWFQINFFQKGLGTDLLDTPYWRSGGSGYSNFSNWSTDYGSTYNVFEALFQLISFANMTIEGAASENITWDNPSDYEYVIAQSKFFRGYAYLTLGECYGGVPIVDEVITTPRFDFVRSTREETYKFAIQNFEEAISGMPDYPTEAGRVAKGATYHYLSEAYLALAIEMNNSTEYLNKAIEAATKTMELHSLMTDRFGSRAIPNGGTAMNGVAAYVEDGDVFFDLFQRGNLDYVEGNTEALWTLQNDYAIQKEYGGNNYLPYPREFGPVLRDAKFKAEYIEEGSSDSPWSGLTTAYVGGRGVSSVAPTNYATTVIWQDKFADDLRNSAVNIRREFICLDEGHSMYGQVVPVEMLDESTLDRFYPVWTKFSPLDDWGYEDLSDGGDRSNMYRDEYACRLAETYLLRAEAYFRLGNNTQAAADINTLRRRAQCAYEVSADEISIDLILDERARELFLEERRWSTLLRMGGTVATDQIAKYGYCQVDYPSATAPSGWNLFPFPQKVIDSNLDTVLEQNPGWN
ncbi:MAG: RagB/SusD family nutrient uptake outer membrane protein [Tannerellaceae bacterium]|nr:RagB/SusD family nutrient uptake outer membrane protein [Tannerellaceae bacterium]